MFRTIEATVDVDGTVRLDEPVAFGGARRALATILEPMSAAQVNECALLSEAVLADGWAGPLEDAAWAHLADLPSIDDAADSDGSRQP